MIDALILRFDAPMMSFGGVMVDARGVTQDHPGLAMLTGLLANALGWEHRDADQTTALQSRLRYAARRDRPGERLVDFHTVDLGQDFLEAGWTTRGVAEGRGGGSAKEGTHIRYRHYLVDAMYTVALTLDPIDATPTLADVERALLSPERPLFLGRKTCLPADRLVDGRVAAESLCEALAKTPRFRRGGPWTERRWNDVTDDRVTTWWPDDGREDPPSDVRRFAVVDERDWHNQIVVGERIVRERTTLCAPRAVISEPAKEAV